MKLMKLIRCTLLFSIRNSPFSQHGIPEHLLWGINPFLLRSSTRDGRFLSYNRQGERLTIWRFLVRWWHLYRRVNKSSVHLNIQVTNFKGAKYHVCWIDVRHCRFSPVSSSHRTLYKFICPVLMCWYICCFLQLIASKCRPLMHWTFWWRGTCCRC